VKFPIKRNHSFPAAFFWGQNYGSREIFLNTKCEKGALQDLLKNSKNMYTYYIFCKVFTT
jgi:hypothetical protein